MRKNGPSGFASLVITCQDLWKNRADTPMIFSGKSHLNLVMNNGALRILLDHPGRKHLLIPIVQILISGTVSQSLDLVLHFPCREADQQSRNIIESLKNNPESDNPILLNLYQEIGKILNISAETSIILRLWVFQTNTHQLLGTFSLTPSEWEKIAPSEICEINV